MTAAKAVPIGLHSPSWSAIAAGASMAPIRPSPASSSEAQASAVTVATAAMPAARTSAISRGTRSYRAVAASSVAYPPAIPAPAAASAECTGPYARCSQRPAPKTRSEASAPRLTRSTGPIQPRFTASTKKKTIPSSVTRPPAHASAFGPRRSSRDTWRSKRVELMSRSFHAGPRGLAAGGAWAWGRWRRRRRRDRRRQHRRVGSRLPLRARELT